MGLGPDKWYARCSQVYVMSDAGITDLNCNKKEWL